MESLVIIIIGLIFSTLSKSVKDKKEIEKEKNKRKEELSQNHYSSKPKAEKKQKSLREIFIEELEKVGDEDDNLGDIFKNTFAGKAQNESKHIEVEEATNLLDEKYMSEEEYRSQLEARNAAYMEPETYGDGDNLVKDLEIVTGENQVKHGVLARKQRRRSSNSQYNPFSKSLNRKDIVRGIIFSEVLGQPKSIKNQRRSM